MTQPQSPLPAADRAALAELLYPAVETDLAALRARHGAPRELPEGAMVTRFAPSPTGFIHIGSTMAALLCWKLAQQSDGVFILRIEDTDQNREDVHGGALPALLLGLLLLAAGLVAGCAHGAAPTGSLVHGPPAS